jgi:hypothetical protein
MHLSRLLDTDDAQLSQTLEIIHKSLDGPSHDVQVLGEIAEKSTHLKRALSLDPHDTTGHELYVSLRQRVREDNERIGRSIGIQHPNAVSEATPRIISAVKSEFAKTLCFVPKASRMKLILKKNPPKKVMGLLHYRSIDSMLKHEQPSHLVLIARYIEGRAWNQKHETELSGLHASDFETRQVEIIWLDKAVLVDVFAPSQKKHHLVLHAKEAGCVAVAPTAEKVINSYTIRTVTLLMHYIQEILYLSTYAKVIMTHPRFGELYGKAVVSEQDTHFQLARYPLHWRTLHHAVHKGQLSDVFPPHMSSDEWHTRRANDALHSLNGHVGFWRDHSYVICGQDEHVSGNVIDVAIDDSYDSSFGEHSLKYARRDLEQELFSRYLREPRVHTVILKRYGVL